MADRQSNRPALPRASYLAVGEPVTLFTRGLGLGPFNCHNCVHMQEDGECAHPVMIRLSSQPRTAAGLPKVGKDDCCRYVRRPGDRTGAGR